MIGVYAIVAIALIVAGAAVGIVVLVTLGIRNEEKTSRHQQNRGQSNFSCNQNSA